MRNVLSAGTSWLPPGWNTPSLGERHDDEVSGSDADSYADRPHVTAPHALHVMGMTLAARYRSTAAVVALGRSSCSPARTDPPEDRSPRR